MSDVEWYIESGSNSQSKDGPYSAKQIVSLYQEGKLLAQAKVTTARMGNDWVSVSDLVQAYRDMYQQQKEKSVLGEGGNFAAPPRPTEQLEASRLITLNPKETLGDQGDATESLFQALQAVREKKSAQISHQKDERLGQLSRAQPKIPPQVTLVIVLSLVGAIGIWGSLKLLDRLKSEPKPEVAQTQKPAEAPRPSAPARTGGSLLSTGGSGASRPATTYTPPPEPGGGAVRLENGDPRNENPEPQPMDPVNDAIIQPEVTPAENTIQDALDNARPIPPESINTLPHSEVPVPAPDSAVAPQEPSP